MKTEKKREEERKGGIRRELFLTGKTVGCRKKGGWMGKESSRKWGGYRKTPCSSPLTLTFLSGSSAHAKCLKLTVYLRWNFVCLWPRKAWRPSSPTPSIFSHSFPFPSLPSSHFLPHQPLCRAPRDQRDSGQRRGGLGEITYVRVGANVSPR